MCSLRCTFGLHWGTQRGHPALSGQKSRCIHTLRHRRCPPALLPHNWTSCAKAVQGCVSKHTIYITHTLHTLHKGQVFAGSSPHRMQQLLAMASTGLVKVGAGVRALWCAVACGGAGMSDPLRLASYCPEGGCGMPIHRVETGWDRGHRRPQSPDLGSWPVLHVLPRLVPPAYTEVAWNLGAHGVIT